MIGSQKSPIIKEMPLIEVHRSGTEPAGQLLVTAVALSRDPLSSTRLFPSSILPLLYPLSPESVPRPLGNPQVSNTRHDSPMGSTPSEPTRSYYVVAQWLDHLAEMLSPLESSFRSEYELP